MSSLFYFERLYFYHIQPYYLHSMNTRSFFIDYRESKFKNQLRLFGIF